MRNRVGIVLTLALVCGGLAAWLAFTFLRGPSGPTVAGASEAPSTQVLVAARDMELGDPVGREDVKIVDWPASAVPAGYSASASEVVGRGLLTSVKANEPFLSGKLARKEAGGGLAIVIPEGKRAMSVEVDEVIGVAGNVLPGTRVDVLVTVDPSGNRSNPVTQVFLQNIEVMAVDQTRERDPDGDPQTAAVVTLLVDPAQAERLALASGNGRIQLALRNTLDPDSVETAGARVANLIVPPRRPRTRAAPSRPGPPARHSIEVYRGPERETSTVDSEPDEPESGT